MRMNDALVVAIQEGAYLVARDVPSGSHRFSVALID